MRNCDIKSLNGGKRDERWPVPCLVGSDLKRIYHGQSKDTYLALPLKHWTGNVK